MDVSLQALGAFLAAFGAFIGALVLAYRGLSGDRFTRRVSESAALLTGYTEMVKNLRLEISEIRSDHDKEMLRNKQQYQADLERLSTMHRLELSGIISTHNEERKHWEAERVRLSNQISEFDERLDELRTQLYLLKNPLPETQTPDVKG